MASNLKYSASLKNAQQDAITTKLGANCLIQIYSGTQPANPDTAITSQVLLATLTGNATFAPAASGGTLTLNSITSGTAGNTGTATWFRLATSGGTAHIDGTVGTSGSDLNLNNTSINATQTVSVTSWTFANGN
jgi:UDP-N-acetylmuramyl tripeptide synthase